jgi:hypothetical protein
MIRPQKKIDPLLFVAAILCGMVMLAFVGFFFLWMSQATSLEEYTAACKSAATRLPVAVEFEELFPGKTDHFITHFGFNRHGGDKTNTWNSEAYFSGRYSLTMQIEVKVDYWANTISRAGESLSTTCGNTELSIQIYPLKSGR